MVMTPSTMLTLGTEAPDFELVSTEGQTVRLGDYAGKPLLVAFICNHCPFVKHLGGALADFAREYEAKGLATVAISSNDVEQYPEDGLEGMAEEKANYGYPFAYAWDETQDVAKAYRAACTPDFFLFNADHQLVYRGQFDETRPDKGTPTGADMRSAADTLLAGNDIPKDQAPSVGCNIKWKKGGEPDYFGAQ